MALSFKCSKCNGEMQEGVVVDLGYTAVLQSMWVEDQAGASGSPGTIDSHKRKIKTLTYRCASCGFLDSYAK